MREGSWALARDCFAAADTAEAFEGLSWAAWWLDDAETVFSAREHAYRLYLERGEPAAAARMATWIGADQNDFHGAAAVAAAGSSGPGGCSNRCPPGRTTAGSRSTPAMSRTARARRERRARSRARGG